MTHPSPHHRRAGRSSLSTFVVGCAAWCALSAGCRGLDATAWKRQPADEGLAHWEVEEKNRLAQVWDKVMGRESAPPHDPLRDAAGRQELEQAQALYDAGEFRDAEKQFKSIAKRYKHSPVREEAMFLKAEAQFAQEKYSWAQDSYDDLMNEYPSTRHMDAATHKMYTIARTWLGFPEPVATSDIQLVNAETPRLTPPPAPSGNASRFDPTRKVPILPNFHDRRRPIFDTNGRALEALKSVWLKDPTGPLADDALMLAASHHLRNKDYIEADHHYTMLREQYPKSPHLETAFVLNGFVKHVSYQGAAYDGKNLEESEAIKRATLNLFPDNEARERIEGELAQIEEAKADREWEMVRYYQRRRLPKAVAMHCHVILDKYPRTERARGARELLRSLDPSGEELLGLPLRYTETPDLLPVPRPGEWPRGSDDGVSPAGGTPERRGPSDEPGVSRL